MTTYKMIDIEGVGETYAKKLEEAGIKDSADLLKKAATRTAVPSWKRPREFPES